MKFAEAKSGKRTMLYSVPFQTGKQQYKLSLVLFPNGDRKGRLFRFQFEFKRN